MAKRILITGAAGFIGFHLCKKLVEYDDEVIGLDNLNDYYDINLKKDRLKQVEGRKNFQFLKMDIADRDNVSKLFSEKK
ncbi:MAG: SDR family NAD(P)-dependent oxidoreductase, partial [Desulfobacterales bacterium]|nr:SDR family NAD(P)-dependent oxidoreductase [Desulfobacterales bacterium]